MISCGTGDEHTPNLLCASRAFLSDYYTIALENFFESFVMSEEHIIIIVFSIVIIIRGTYYYLSIIDIVFFLL